MKQFFLACLCVFWLSTAGSAQDMAFRKTKVADAKGKQAPADLVFRQSKQCVEVSVAGHQIAEIPYSTIDKFSYEYTKQHRIKQGAVVMVASLGAGAVVMLTKSKSHFLTVEYRDGAAAKELVLRMDKSEYKTILDTVKAQTGKEVEFLADAGSKKKAPKT